VTLLTLLEGDSLEYLKEMSDNTIGSFVTDPPYGIRFMNKKWDYEIPSVEFWEECYRVLKPGGHMLVFCGTRTQHRMAINLEDAGFEIRDVVSWLYSQGMPHSYNIPNGIEGTIVNGSANKKDFNRLDGDEAKKGLGYTKMGKEQGFRPTDYGTDGAKPTYKTNIKHSTDEAKEWEGWGTTLRPSCEFITLVRKPISEKNVPLNILKWGVGGLNIDASRIESDEELFINVLDGWSGFGEKKRPKYKKVKNETGGKWPRNVIFNEEAGAVLDEQTGKETSRFYYCAKPNKKEKDVGLGKKNPHPTIKPVDLMKYLVRMITPPNEICVDPFMGSGSTLMACKELNISAIGIERDAESFQTSTIRVDAWNK